MEDYKYLDCYTGYIEDGKLYVVSVLFGIVLEYDLGDFSYNILTQINLPNAAQMVRTNFIVKINQFLYITLNNGWNVFEYDMENKQMEVYGNDFEYIDGKDLIVKSHLYQDRIWLFPYDVSHKIKIFHIKTKEFEERISIKDILNQKGYGVKKGSYMCLDVFLEKCTCVLAVYDSPYIVEMNLNTESCNTYEVKSNARIEIMSYVGGEYWLSYTDNKSVERWDPADGILETYEPEKNYMYKGWIYRYIFPYKEKIIIVPTQDEIICIIDRKTRQEKVLDYSKEIQRVHNRERWIFYGSIEYNDKILLLPFSATYFIMVDLQNNRLELYSGKFGTDVINEYYIKPSLPQNILLENDMLELPEYLDFMSGYDSGVKKRISGEGGKIWTQLNTLAKS